MREQLKDIFRDILGVEVNDDSTVDNTENWDSLSHCALLTAIEEEFDIDFTIEEMARIKTFKEMNTVVGGKLNGTTRR